MSHLPCLSEPALVLALLAVAAGGILIGFLAGAEYAIRILDRSPSRTEES